MATGRFDVVVVGARTRGTQAVAELATAVGRVTGLAPGAVQRGLEVGEVVVHQGLSKTQAVLAARTVQQLGGIVDVRPARDDAGAIAVEPDEEIPPVRRPTAESKVVAAAPPPTPAPAPTPTEPVFDSAGAILDPNAPVLDLGGPPVAPRFEVGAADAPKLELDFRAAGLPVPPPGAAALRSPMAASPPPPLPEPPALGLIAEDRVASVLGGAAIAATVGMLIAFALVRADARAIADRLEPELADALVDPVAVQAGRLRSPDTIIAEIDDGLAGVRSKYFTIWAAIALVGAGVGLLKRPSRSA